MIVEDFRLLIRLKIYAKLLQHVTLGYSFKAPIGYNLKFGEDRFWIFLCILQMTLAG